MDADGTAKLERTMEVARPHAFGSTNENVPATMRWLDAMLETEMMFSLYYGEENSTEPGAGWIWDENGKITSTNDGSMEVKNYIDCNTMFWGPGKYISETFNMPPQRTERRSTARNMMRQV